MRGMGRPTDQERQEAVKILAERHGITRVDEEYEDGETLLSRAAGCESCLDLLRLLIAAGADVDHADADGCTPLYPPEIVNGDLAMSIGGRFYPERIGSRQWKAFAGDIGLPSDMVSKRLHALWARIIAALPDTLQETRDVLPVPGIIPELKKQILQRTMSLNRNL